MELKQYRNAIRDFDKVIAAKPMVHGAYHDRGIAKFESNDLRGAILDFTGAIDNKLADAKLAYENPLRGLVSWTYFERLWRFGLWRGVPQAGEHWNTGLAR